MQSHEPSWPPALDEGAGPPIRSLYVSGRPLDPGAPAIAVVGTRRPTAAGLFATSEIVTGLALEGYTIVSGLAVGIDAAAHEAALDAGGPTIAVLGCGHNIDYPKRNRALRARIETHGTVLSEYGADIEPKPFMFPLRNRIIAALSLGVVVIEGTIQSGALVTARLALDANREVFAVPGSVRSVMSEGPNELIRRGEAALVTKVDHVLEGLGAVLAPTSDVPGAPAPDLTPAQYDVLAHLDDVPAGVDAFARALQRPADEVSAALTVLELSGFAERTYRGYVVSDRGAAVRAAPRPRTSR